jgi:hypothetical protein
MAGPDNSSGGWQFQVGVKQISTEGFPSPPSLWMSEPGSWRFRWQVMTGSQTISCYVKQEINTAPFPTMVVRANPDIGIVADITGTSPGGAGWVKIGPITATASSVGVVWVELRANNTGMDASSANPLGPWYPCYFDEIGP